MLAPNTTLHVPSSFGRKDRRVVLVGEAYFAVNGTSRAPFSVESEWGSKARVLGTQFDVRSYAGTRMMHVAVMSGRVYVTPRSGPGRVVTNGSVAVVTDSTAVVSPANVTPYSLWTAGTLTFDEAPVPEVLAELARWYGVRFRLADSSLGKTRITAVFNTRSPSEGMDVLKTLLKASMTVGRAGDTTIVTLHAKGEPASPSAPSRELHRTLPLNREVGR
jgi:transmembrane sensor